MKKIVVLWMLLTVFFSCQKNDDSIGGMKEEEEKEEKKDDPTPQPTIERKDIPLTATEKQLAEKNNVFAFDFMRAIVNQKDNANENIMISPLSASLALALLNNGAEGETHKEIQKALGYEDFSREEMNGYFQKMVTAMKEIDTQVTFESANSLWISNHFPVLESYINTNKQYYDAEVRNVDFSDPKTLNLINEWCSEKTHGKIPHLLDGLPEVMALINALYFKGEWKEIFDEEITRNETFYNANGQLPQVPMMIQSSPHLNYYNKDEFSMVEIPFGNEAFSMVILLPEKNISLSHIVEKLSVDIWMDFINNMHPENITVLRLPRFKIENSHKLINPFSDMGMKSMFSANADFSSIMPSVGLFVQEALQKTYINVNEQGCEAAGATYIGMATSSGMEVYNYITVDRPFLYFIKEKSTGTIFFMGQVNNLKAD